MPQMMTLVPPGVKSPKKEPRKGDSFRFADCGRFMGNPGAPRTQSVVDETRWDEKAGLRRDAVGSQVIDVLKAQEIKETGNEED